MSRPTLALALIAKNEEHNLPQLLKSVEGCFDEIHLTDTGSTDRTVELAKAAGCIVHHFDWCDDFAAARNASFAPVKTDYICWFDLDDVLENPEVFKLWRDNVMGLADFWLATYHYSSDANGTPVCSFVRERVVKNFQGLSWKYFCHEGIVPAPNSAPLKSSYVSTWAVRHMRTEADLKADRSRNLQIFEKNKHRFDARMQYYYGKELFEAGKPVEAINELLRAVAAPDGIELHDRTLALQYACYAYLQCNQFEQAINTAYSGLMLSPNRAEFHCIIGDAYLKMGRPQDAIPSYSAAKGCQKHLQGAMAGALFNQEAAYSLYPRNQLARVYYHMGSIDQAMSEATACETLHQQIETHQIKKELEQAQVLVSGYKNAKPCEDIVISCPPQAPYLWDADIAKERAMGGSETACIEMASWLHKLSGRPVRVFNVRESDKLCDGVDYISNRKLPAYMSENKPWLHIAWRHNIKLTDAPTFLWGHDLFTPGGENHSVYERNMALTPFHARYLRATQGIPADKIYLTRNGLKPERFDKGTLGKNPNKFVFPSSPDRGLDRAMRVLDKVREKYPEIELHVFYGIEHLPQWGHQALHDKLKVMIQERPWVKYHGKTQQDVLMKHFKEAAIWLHPCDFIETSCISAMEIVCSGVYPVTRRLGGLADTLATAESLNMATLIDSDCVTELEYQKYIDATIQALDERAWERVSMDAESLSWESIAKEWLRDLPQIARCDGRTA